MPPVSSRIARFANEGAGRRKRSGPDGKPISHFELYLRAMDEIGADTTLVKGFMSQIDLGARFADVFDEMSVPPGVAEFVNETLRCAIDGSLVEVASFFFFGREDVIPEMFERLLKSWGNAKAEVPHFAYSLNGISSWTATVMVRGYGRCSRRWPGRARAIGKRRPALQSGPSLAASSSGIVF